uniref:Uncharacterized protein n=1 Tax=Pseudomonas phage vB_PaeS_HTN2 TaxID=3236647 RepID=A0AB39AI51_9VIRU
MSKYRQMYLDLFESILQSLQNCARMDHQVHHIKLSHLAYCVLRSYASERFTLGNPSGPTPEAFMGYPFRVENLGAALYQVAY